MKREKTKTSILLLEIRKWFINGVANDFNHVEQLNFYKNWKLEKVMQNIGLKEKGENRVFKPQNACTSTISIEMIALKEKMPWCLKPYQ